jgi:cytochrome c oxidase assembly factor CtaG
VRRVARAVRQDDGVIATDLSWSLEPGPIVLIVLAGGLYLWRWIGVRRAEGARSAGGWRLVSFMTGLALVAVALISPVDALADQLFVMHMVQHIILLDLSAVLLVCGLTKVIMRPITRHLTGFERAAGPLGHPVFAVVAYIAVMWIWHIPAMYDAALRDQNIHLVEHLMLATAGLLYWWHLFSPIRQRQRLGGLGPVVYMTSTKLFVGLLGIMLIFAPHALYPFYEHAQRTWGLSAHTDQQVAGAVMALEQSIVMGVALAYLFIRALTESEREQQRAERYGAV